MLLAHPAEGSGFSLNGASVTGPRTPRAPDCLLKIRRYRGSYLLLVMAQPLMASGFAKRNWFEPRAARPLINRPLGGTRDERLFIAEII